MHPVGGLWWSYANLLRHTPEEQPIYGIQARGFADEHNLPDTLDDVVTESVEQIRSVRPHGTYRLLGWSFGGILAHMVVTRLQAESEQVDRLILLDSYPPSSKRDDQIKRNPPPDFVWRELAMATNLSLSGEAANTLIDANTIAELARQQHHILGALPLRQLEQIAAVMTNNSRLAPNIKLGQFDGDILLYVVTRRPPDFDSQTMNPKAWKPYCRGAIRTVAIDFTHNKMLSPDALKQMGVLPLSF